MIYKSGAEGLPIMVRPSALFLWMILSDMERKRPAFSFATLSKPAPANFFILREW
jgi:hypothetical protein